MSEAEMKLLSDIDRAAHMMDEEDKHMLIGFAAGLAAAAKAKQEKGGSGDERGQGD